MLWKILIGELVLQTEQLIKNDPESVGFRRNSKTLVILGMGVIIFGFWSVIKVAAYTLMGIPLFDATEMKDIGPEQMPFLMTLLVIILTGDVIVRLIVGISARKEGLGRKVRSGYLILNVWLILFGLFTVGSVIREIFVLELSESPEDYFTSLFLELSSLVITLEVFISALSVRRYKRKYGRSM